MLFMFRERRSILITFVLALAIAMGTTTLWNSLFLTFNPYEGSLDPFFGNAMSFAGWPVLLCLVLCIPFVALHMADEARQLWPATTRCATWICGGIFLGSEGWMAILFSQALAYTNEISILLKTLVFTIIFLFFASVLFLLITAGRKALAQGMWGTFSLALLFLACSCLLQFGWKTGSLGGSAFDVWVNIIGPVSLPAGLSALALFLATGTFGQQSFQRVLKVGVFLISCVTLFFLTGTGWTISTWIQQGNGLKVPQTGFWLLFHGYWMLPFWLAVIGGGMALFVAIIALVRGFQFTKSQPLPDIDL